jgi:endonuclease/exonuclease/phosphatase family metal-dependent hydrolase
MKLKYGKEYLGLYLQFLKHHFDGCGEVKNLIIKVLSYNIHKGRSFFLRHRTWDALDKLVHKVEPDIIFFQEFLSEPQAEILLEKFADKLWPHHSFGKNATMGDYHYGNAILSKYPFIETYSNDISTNKLEKRGLLYGKIQINKKDNLFLFCTHLDLTYKGRKSQLKKIQKYTSSLTKKSDHVLFVGDFNDWDEKLHPEIQKTLNFKEASTEVHGFLAETSPSIYPKFSLDRIYYRNLKPHSTEVIKDKNLKILSDHLPVVFEFKIASK